MSAATGTGQYQHVDFNLHDIAGVRLVDARATDVAVVARQLGPIQAPLKGEPDILIRFVDRLPDSGRLRTLGLNDAGFTDDAFLILRSKHKARAKVQIPFEQIGDGCEIICERGLPAVPLLIPILNLTVLSKGVLPLHASAFISDGRGVLVTGWAKGGKTEMLLAFMSHGATYVGDEWIYVSEDGQCMYGIPEPIRVWNWHLEELPAYRSTLARRDRWRLRALEVAADSAAWVSDSGVTSRRALGKLMRRVEPVVRRQLYVHLPPAKTFGADSFALESSLDRIFFVGSHDSPEITIEEADPQEVARRMVFSLQEERLDFLSYYWKFRFAFPERKNELIEDAEARQLALLSGIFGERTVYEVYHPYPFSIPALYRAVEPYIGSRE